MNALSDAVSQTHFSPLDWAIVLVYLLGSLAIGWIGRKYIHTMTDYIGAGRAIGPRLGIATMTGTELGLITVMYSSQKGFTGGFAAFHIAVLAGIVALFVGLTGFIVTRLRAMKVLTIPEFYERRFGKRVRVLGGIMLVFGGVLNMGLFLKVGAKFIVGVTGLSSQGWALPAIMIFLLVLVLTYTVMGGMVSVVVTDYIQFVVLSIGLLLTTALAISSLGWNQIIEVWQTERGPAGFDPLAEGSGFGPTYVVWMLFLGLVNCAIWPTAIARALIMKDTRAVKTQFRWSALSFTVRFIIPYFWGIAAFAYIMTQAPDLKEAFFPAEGEGADNLFAMPIFLGRLLPIGVLGLVTAAMIAAFMSTHDSYLLCWSSVITQDIVAPLRKKPLSNRGRLSLTRWLIVAIGLYILYWGIVYQGEDDIWDYMAVSGAIYFSGAFALLVGGLYWKKASSVGALLALLAGLTALLGLDVVRGWIFGDGLAGTPLEGWAGAEYGLLSIAMTTIMMVVGSLVFPDRQSENSVEA